MKVIVLGTAAGGGFPQWNCACALCAAARQGRLPARTGDCVAVSGDARSWWLLNTSPDLCAQLLATPALAPGPGTRDTPLRGVLLTDAEADHILGLPLLRGGPPLEVLAGATVLEALPLREVIDSYTPWHWTALTPDTPYELAGGLTVTLHPIGRKAPKFVNSPTEYASWVCAYRIEARPDGGTLLYAPCFDTWSPALDALVASVDCALLDGTFHSADELAPVAPGATAQRTMGHLPITGPGGSLAALTRHPRVRRIYTHLNNTNPLLDPDSPAHRSVTAAGVQLLPDGTELTLPRPAHQPLHDPGRPTEPPHFTEAAPAAGTPQGLHPTPARPLRRAGP
ncbi:pyrroloquinoline quinone biosynthesis protein PqqB [Streptacidiphilus pinicola]|uniref:Coenzyme PQQ synthesis protein B n=1 Tax=Streptacidiphilus pinicola TaxID=2219663 RepID=A0A2X0IKT3_9ACTN|nr:pyrroloquinoline quinone biosynthesis protein PqqB [Streptacidiphilus pinicola]RAG85724.1 pyrroloquinoline quinone biosynthesis protein PqqB [Streptacidiphilus pinicola]